MQKVIITLGGRGVYYNDGESEAWLHNYDVPVVDTTGAGDAFNGGLLAGLSQGLPLKAAALYGNVVANLAVTRIGTAPAMPAAREIAAFIQENNIPL